LAQRDSQRWCIVDADQPADVVQSELRKIILAKVSP
jgi:thymidylate kinase